MNYSLSYSLGSGGRTQDPDAASYISLVRAAGGTVDSNKTAEINTFYKTAKSTGYYTSLKRLYLPIWGVAAANAIDLITGASGTWNGGVTHGAGYVVSNGTTGYFDMGVTPTSLGLSANSGLMFALVKTAPSTTAVMIPMGNYNSESSKSQLYTISDSIVANLAGAANVTYSAATSTLIGIYLVSRESPTSIELYTRKTAGITKHDTNTTDVTGGLAGTNNMSVMAQDAGGFSDSQFGSYGLGLGLNDSTVSSFSLHLKNLWEGTTGLTLP